MRFLFVGWVLLLVGCPGLLTSISGGDVGADVGVVLVDTSVDMRALDATAGDQGPRPDARQTLRDVGPDAPVSDGGRPLDAGTADSGTDTPAATGVTGRVRYERRNVTAAGLSAPISDPLADVNVALVVDGVPVEQTLTAADGSFSFIRTAPAGATVRIFAEGASDPISVTDQAGNLYAFDTPVVAGRGDIFATEEMFGGALALFETMDEGLAYAHGAFNRPELFPNLEVRWEYGRTTPGGTSYAFSDEIWILGGPDDTDEFDTAVVLHELGHYLQGVYGFTNVVEGNAHAGVATDPRLAWSEGWASFFSSAARGSAIYRDTFLDGSLGIDEDVSRFPMSGEYVASPSGGLNQTLSEWVITSSLYNMLTSGDPATQMSRSFESILAWSGDRSLPGNDLVDFLDGYLCFSGRSEDALLQRVVIDDRRFPYDLSPACPKPGDTTELSNLGRGLQRFLHAPARVDLPGELVRDERGRSIRLIHLQPPTD